MQYKKNLAEVLDRNRRLWSGEGTDMVLAKVDLEDGGTMRMWERALAPGVCPDYRRMFDVFIDDFKRRENVLRDALYTAQKMSDDIKAQAVREAQCTVQEAHVKAEGLHQQAQLRAQQVERNILDLKLERETLVLALKDLTQRVRSLLDGIQEAKAKENVASFSKENA